MDKTSYNMKRKDRVAVLGLLMEGPVGREWVWNLLSDCMIFVSTIGAHHEMCAREGKRTIGLKVYKDIQSDAGLRKKYELMQNEYIRSKEGQRNENE